jgi:glutamate synthase (NADPH/NADH) large chain
MEAGIRNRVEIWADGGYRHAHDVVKLHCLGANRIGFGTLAMVSLGCTICRGCQLDTCHVGIATQIETAAEAQLKGLKKFTPQELERAAASCARFFEDLGEEVRALTAQLGYERTQDLVGRSDLLVQARARESVDVSELIAPLDEMLDLEPLDMPGVEEPAGHTAPRSLRLPAGNRVLGTELAGGMARSRIDADLEPAGVAPAPPAAAEGAATEAAGLAVLGTVAEPTLAAAPDPAAIAIESVAGQGLGAFNVDGVDITVIGGAQDGVAKTMYGGKVAVLKGVGRLGTRVNGSVGKSFAYGAQRGRLFVQGDADSRFCIRLSGADVVIGGEPRAPLDDSLGCLADRANLKGFAFEYMTAGRAVVLGDPGPWFCAGQTGGRVYLRVNPELNLTRAALERRRGKGAKVVLAELDELGTADVGELLEAYAVELDRSGQPEEATRVRSLAAAPRRHFLVSLPLGEQTDPSISTE